MSTPSKNDAYEVEQIVNKRFDDDGKVRIRWDTRDLFDFQTSRPSQIEYKIRWKGFPGEDTWEPLAHLEGCAEKIETFENYGYPVEKNVKGEKIFVTCNSRTSHHNQKFQFPRRRRKLGKLPRKQSRTRRRSWLGSLRFQNSSRKVRICQYFSD